MSAAALPVANRAQAIRAVRAAARSHRWPLAGSLLMYVLAALTSLVAPWALGQLVEELGQSPRPDRLHQLIGMVALAALAQTGLTWLALRALARVSVRIFAQVRLEVIEHVVALPVSVIESTGTGDLVTRTTRDIDEVSQALRRGVPELISGVILTVVTLGGMVWVNPWLASLVLIAVPGLWWGIRRYLTRCVPVYLRIGQSYSEVTGGLAETIDGASTVAGMKLHQPRLARTSNDVAQIADGEMTAMRLRMHWFPVQEMSYTLPVAAVIALGYWAVGRGIATTADVTAMAFYMVAVSYPADTVLGKMDNLQVAATSLARVVGIGLVGPDRTPGTARPTGDDLVIEDLGFAYAQGREVLHSVSLNIAAGEHLVIVGPSGAGKSTLGKLIAGVHVPTAGSIRLGGVSVSELPDGTIREHVALLTQEHHTFAGSLASNVRLAHPQATDQQLCEALMLVEAWDWAQALPQGLETGVGSGGVALTSTQAQQVALARVLLADPPILILDEATSLLDTGSARRLEGALHQVMQGRTVITIAHRLSTGVNADRVAVVEDGQITQLGPHHELLATPGSYASLWRAWSQQRVS